MMENIINWRRFPVKRDGATLFWLSDHYKWRNCLSIHEGAFEGSLMPGEGNGFAKNQEQNEKKVVFTLPMV